MTGYGYYPTPVYRDPTDVMGRRIGAFFIDVALVLVFMIIVGAAIAETVTREEAIFDRGCVRNDDLLECDDYLAIDIDSQTVYLIPIGRSSLIVAALSFGYYALFQGLVGGTVGKLLTGIRVVRKSDGQLHGVGRAIVRWVFFLVDGPFTLYICGLVTALVSRGHRRVGDMVAGTYVVIKDAVGQPILLPGDPLVAGYGSPLGYPPTPAYTPPPQGYGAAPEWGAPPAPPAPPPAAPPAPPDAPGWGPPPPP